MRLAQRKAELDATRELEDDVAGEGAPVDVSGEQEREVREGHERFRRLFGGMEDSSDEEEDEGGDDGGSPDEARV